MGGGAAQRDRRALHGPVARRRRRSRSDARQHAQYTIRTPNRDALGAKLKAAGIPTAVYYPKCLHEQPVFASCGNKLGDFPVAEQASREVISLPMHPFLSEIEQDAIVEAVKSALK